MIRSRTVTTKMATFSTVFTAALGSNISTRDQIINQLMVDYKPPASPDYDSTAKRSRTSPANANLTSISPTTMPQHTIPTKEEDRVLAPTGHKPGERWNVWPMLIADIPTTHHAVVWSVFIERFSHSLAMKEWRDIVR